MSDSELAYIERLDKCGRRCENNEGRPRCENIHMQKRRDGNGGGQKVCLIPIKRHIYRMWCQYCIGKIPLQAGLPELKNYQPQTPENQGALL